MLRRTENIKVGISEECAVVMTKGRQTIEIQPLKEKFIISAKRTYLNDSPDLVMIMAMLLRRGFNVLQTIDEDVDQIRRI